jgi:integral membrane protein (TIGR00529 family)
MMEKYGILDNMIKSLEYLIGSAKITLLLAPAIIGTLLVTGGALMSCPVVKNLGERLSVEDDKMAAINLIFRHALYFIFPLSPTLILASQVGEINLFDLIRIQFPIALSLYVLGYIIFLRGYKDSEKKKRTLRGVMKNLGEFLYYCMPLIVSVFGALILKLPFYITLVFGILTCVLIDLRGKREGSYLIDAIKGIRLKMVLAILGIIYFKIVIDKMDGLDTILDGVLGNGIPMELIILISCALISFPLASTQPSIAMLYPIILPLSGSYDLKLLYAMLIYTSGFMFYYISPLHLCQVLTLEYFDVKIKKLYKNYIIILPLTYSVMLFIYFFNKLGY